MALYKFWVTNFTGDMSWSCFLLPFPNAWRKLSLKLKRNTNAERGGVDGGGS